MITLNRAFAVVLALLVGLWTWAEVMYVRQKAADVAFYNTQVLPPLNEAKQQAESEMQAFHDRKEGKVTSMMHYPPVDVSTPLAEWTRMIRERNHYDGIRASAFSYVGRTSWQRGRVKAETM